MKGALACYVEAVRALQDAGVRLRGDVLIAAVCGEIEKTQYGDHQGAQYRGYAAGSRYLVSHGGVADMCLRRSRPGQGRARRLRRVWFAFASRQLHRHAFSEGKRASDSIVRMHAVTQVGLDGSHVGGLDSSERLSGREGDRQRRCDRGGFGWRVVDAAPTPTLSRRARARRRSRWRRRREALDLVRLLLERWPDDVIEGKVYVSAGLEIDEGHQLVGVIDASHEEVFGEHSERDVTRWFSARVGAGALRHPDRQLRNVDRAHGRRARRESRDRRAGQDGTDVRARRAEDLLVKLVTFDERKRRPGRGRRGRSARRSDDAHVLRARRRRRHGRARAARRGQAACADHPQEVLPYGRATSASTRTSRRTSPGRTRSRRGSSSFRIVDAIIGPDEPIVYPEHLTEELDYELELAVMLKRRASGSAPRRRWTTSAAT